MIKYTIKNLAKALLIKENSVCQFCGTEAEIFLATHIETGLKDIRIFCPDCHSEGDLTEIIKSIEEESGEDEC